MLITTVASKVEFLKTYCDIVDFYGEHVEPDEIRFDGNRLNIGGLVLEVENGRYAFAQALSCFDEPTVFVHYNSSEVNYGKFCTIGGNGFGYVRHRDKILRIPHVGKVVIGNGVVLHNHVNIDRGVTGATVIGDDCKIDSFCHIAHNVKLGKGNTLAAHTIIEGSCVVGDNNTFGTSVIVLRKVRIGNNNLFGSGCVVTKDVEDNGVYVGNPARLIKYQE